MIPFQQLILHVLAIDFLVLFSNANWSSFCTFFG
jgi:hypothetical protein